MSDLIGRPQARDHVTELTREHTAEIHSCKRLHERYGVPIEMCPETVIEHLAMILAGESTLCFVQTQAGWHYGKEVRIIVDLGIEYLVSYDPKIMRIATYLPRGTEKSRRLVRSAKAMHGIKLKRKRLP